MEPINEGDIFRLTHDSHGVMKTDHLLIAVRNQRDETVYGLFISSGEGSGYDDATMAQVSNPAYDIGLSVARDACEKL